MDSGRRCVGSRRHAEIVELSETDGIDERMRELVTDTLERSAPTSTRCTRSVAATRRSWMPSLTSVASSRSSSPMTSTTTTCELIRRSRLSAVLHHDLHQDMRRACQVIVAAHGAIDIERAVDGIDRSRSSRRTTCPVSDGWTGARWVRELHEHATPSEQPRLPDAEKQAEGEAPRPRSGPSGARRSRIADGDEEQGERIPDPEE